MKLCGFVGTGTGKMGASVFAVRKGQQIVRQYQPVVANPNTDAQIAQRAKFKLLTQLGQMLKGGLLLRPVGGESRRNRFVSLNMRAIDYDVMTKVAIARFADMRISEGREPLVAVRTDTNEGIRVEIAGSWDGMALGVVTSPQFGMVIGGGLTVNETSTVVPMTPSLQGRTTVIVAAFRFVNEASRTKYMELAQGQTSGELSVAVQQMFDAGEIVTSQTVVAEREA